MFITKKKKGNFNAKLNRGERGKILKVGVALNSYRSSNEMLLSNAKCKIANYLIASEWF